MTPEKIKLLQQHFARVYPIKAALSQSFYDRLFEIAPEVRPFFPENMKQQREKLADTLAFIVKNLDNTDHLLIAVEGLARRHRNYGAQPEHFAPVGEALIYALHRHTPEEGMSDAEAEAWGEAYALLVSVMTPHLEDSNAA